MTKDVAIVTGGGSGIGAAVVRRLTSDGWQVAVVGRRTDRLEEIARETGCLAIAGDVATPGVGATIVARTLEHFGRIDGLVCNAGRSTSIWKLCSGSFRRPCPRCARLGEASWQYRRLALSAPRRAMRPM